MRFIFYVRLFECCFDTQCHQKIIIHVQESEIIIIQCIVFVWEINGYHGQSVFLDETTGK